MQCDVFMLDFYAMFFLSFFMVCLCCSMFVVDICCFFLTTTCLNSRSSGIRKTRRIDPRTPEAPES